MVSALDSAQAGRMFLRPTALALIALGGATALTMSGLPIVDTMVSVNVVYIASVGVSLVGLLRDEPEQHVDETWVISAGFTASIAVYLLTWIGGPISNAELLSLSVGLASAMLARIILGRRERRDLACRPSDR